MNFTILKSTLLNILDELQLKRNVQDAICHELDGNLVDPSEELDLLHAKLKENNLNDKLIKSVLCNGVPINQLYGHAAILDYYLIFLGLTVPVGGYDFLKSDNDLMRWYKLKIHNTAYGRIAIKHLFGSTFIFKSKVAEAAEKWLFSKWIFFTDDQMLADKDALLLRNQICTIKNARLIIDMDLLKKIFEFNTKDFFYNTEIIEFLNGYNFDIKKFEENLMDNIAYIGCEHRKRLDNCYELIFS